jgi:5-formyltetrahydrofolate cyclo-ligase
MDKKQQRAQALSARRGLSAQERTRYSQMICRRLQALPLVQQAKTIFSYWAAGEEADLGAFHRWALEQGKTLAFPRSYPAGAMEAYSPETMESMAPGKFGILEPEAGTSCRIGPEQIDLVLVPCLAFDGAGRRLGHGGGYYDRYLPQCPQAVRIGVAFEVQRVPLVVCQPWDAGMDMAVTERETYLFKVTCTNPIGGL